MEILISIVHFLSFDFDLGMLVVDQYILVGNTFQYLHCITMLYRAARQL